LGDHLCNGNRGYNIETKSAGALYQQDSYWNGVFPACPHNELEGYHGPDWHWGFRHWVFLAFNVVIVVVQIRAALEDFNN